MDGYASSSSSMDVDGLKISLPPALRFSFRRAIIVSDVKMIKSIKNSKNFWKIFISIALAVLIFFGATAYFLLLHRYRGKEISDEWNASDEFDITSVTTLTKNSGEDFVILNLADVQLCDLEDFFTLPKMRKKIENLVNAVKPDLITLTGDQTWSNENLISLKSLISWLENLGVPYAPIFGNHDYGNEKNSAVLSENKCCDIYESAKHCLFKRGPTNLGALGNYVINIVEDGKIFKTIYMLDSGYEDEITNGQKAWVLWNAEGIKNECGYYPEGIAFMHKPLPEYADAYRDYRLGGETESIGSVEVHYSLYGSSQNGFFELAKSINIRDIVCGHQHGNNFTLLYQGVRLTFALKTGELGGYYQDETVRLDGATVMSLGTETKIENVFSTVFI